MIAYPTESSFGLGCVADNLDALNRILQIKKRPPEKGLIILVSDIEQAKRYIQPLTSTELKQITLPRERATTWLIPKTDKVLFELGGEHPKLAVRVTQHPVARALCDAINAPLVSTSCNRAGEEAMLDACAIKAKMGDELDLIVAGNVGGQSASQIIDLESGQVLRS